MNKIKHILAIFIVLAAIATLAYVLPKTGLENLLPKQDAPEETVADTTAAQDTLPFIDRMKSELEVLQAQYSKRKNRDVWTLGKGRTIINYLLQAQRILEKNGGKVLYMEEVFNDNNANLPFVVWSPSLEQFLESVLGEEATTTEPAGFVVPNPVSNLSFTHNVNSTWIHECWKDPSHHWHHNIGCVIISHNHLRNALVNSSSTSASMLVLPSSDAIT